jgi:hypothetical protein
MQDQHGRLVEVPKNFLDIIILNTAPSPHCLFYDDPYTEGESIPPVAKWWYKDLTPQGVPTEKILVQNRLVLPYQIKQRCAVVIFDADSLTFDPTVVIGMDISAASIFRPKAEQGFYTFKGLMAMCALNKMYPSNFPIRLSFTEDSVPILKFAPLYNSNIGSIHFLPRQQQEKIYSLAESQAVMWYLDPVGNDDAVIGEASTEDYYENGAAPQNPEQPEPTKIGPAPKTAPKQAGKAAKPAAEATPPPPKTTTTKVKAVTKPVLPVEPEEVEEEVEEEDLVEESPETAPEPAPEPEAKPQSKPTLSTQKPVLTAGGPTSQPASSSPANGGRRTRKTATIAADPDDAMTASATALKKAKALVETEEVETEEVEDEGGADMINELMDELI